MNFGGVAYMKADGCKNLFPLFPNPYAATGVVVNTIDCHAPSGILTARPRRLPCECSGGANLAHCRSAAHRPHAGRGCEEKGASLWAPCRVAWWRQSACRSIESHAALSLHAGGPIACGTAGQTTCATPPSASRKA
eukprot:4661245-Prymnesium_polylepis.3